MSWHLVSWHFYWKWETSLTMHCPIIRWLWITILVYFYVRNTNFEKKSCVLTAVWFLIEWANSCMLPFICLVPASTNCVCSPPSLVTLPPLPHPHKRVTLRSFQLVPYLLQDITKYRKHCHCPEMSWDQNNWWEWVAAENWIAGPWPL